MWGIMASVRFHYDKTPMGVPDCPDRPVPLLLGRHTSPVPARRTSDLVVWRSASFSGHTSQQ
jgi:hypothetical protein